LWRVGAGALKVEIAPREALVRDTRDIVLGSGGVRRLTIFINIESNINID
jgi:hypothetical protein